MPENPSSYDSSQSQSQGLVKVLAQVDKGSSEAGIGKMVATSSRTGKGPQPAKGKKKPQTFVIDCAKPVEDKIMEIGTFEKYLHDKIKINNKTGAIGVQSVWACQGQGISVHLSHIEVVKVAQGS